MNTNEKIILNELIDNKDSLFEDTISIYIDDVLSNYKCFDEMGSLLWKEFSVLNIYEDSNSINFSIWEDVLSNLEILEEKLLLCKFKTINLILSFSSFNSLISKCIFNKVIDKFHFYKINFSFKIILTNVDDIKFISLKTNTQNTQFYFIINNQNIENLLLKDINLDKKILFCIDKQENYSLKSGYLFLNMINKYQLSFTDFQNYSFVDNLTILNQQKLNFNSSLGISARNNKNIFSFMFGDTLFYMNYLYNPSRYYSPNVDYLVFLQDISIIKEYAYSKSFSLQQEVIILNELISTGLVDSINTDLKKVLIEFFLNENNSYLINYYFNKSYVTRHPNSNKLLLKGAFEKLLYFKYKRG